MKNKKAQNGTTTIIISFGVMALISAAVITSLVALRNSSGAVTDFSTNTSVVNTTIGNAITGLGNVTSQLGTVGTMVGVGLILVVILGIFGFNSSRTGGGGL